MYLTNWYPFITFQASRLPVAGRQLVGPCLVQVTICERRSVSLDHFVVHITVRLFYFFARLVHSDAFTVADGITNILLIVVIIWIDSPLTSPIFLIKVKFQLHNLRQENCNIMCLQVQLGDIGRRDGPGQDHSVRLLPLLPLPQLPTLWVSIKRREATFTD